MTENNYNTLSKAIIGACTEAHCELRLALLKSIYEEYRAFDLQEKGFYVDH
jgi:hypothetical protein